MAKTINLTVKVDDTDFNQFIKNFNAFSATVGNLNTQFKQINTTMSKTQSNFAVMLDSVKSLMNTLGGVQGIVEKVGKGFMRWGTAIGGIVMMLTTGAGLYGIDRIAASILQKHRQATGLGTTRGGMLGTQIGGQSFLDNPTAVLGALRSAMGGGPEAGAAAGLGVFPGSFGGDAAKAFPVAIRNLHRALQAAAPGTEVAVGQSYTQGKLGLSDQDYVRLRSLTKKELEQELIRMEEIRKATEMSKEAQKGWSSLSIQFTKAKTALESAFGERFAELTKPLEKLSDAFVNLVKMLLETKTVTDIIHWLTTQLNKLTAALEKDPDLIKKKIKEWDEYIEKEWMPLLKLLRESLEGFVDAFHDLSEFVKAIGLLVNNPEEWFKKYIVPHLPWYLGGPNQNKPGSPLFQKDEYYGQPGKKSGDLLEHLRNYLGGGNQAPSTSTSPSSSQQQSTPPPANQPPAQQQTTPPANQTPPAPAPNQPVPGTTTSPETNIPPWARDRGQQGMFMPGNFMNQNYAAAANFRGGTTGVGGSFASMASIANRGGNFGIGGSRSAVNIGGPRNTSMGLAFGGPRGGDINFGDRTGGDIALRGGGRTRMLASVRGGNRIAFFGGAARGRLPGTEMNAFRGVTTVASATTVDNRKGLSMLQGPLDSNNWQMNRTASLSIRNVPGSNVFMQGAGMA